MKRDLSRQVVREIYCEVLFELAEQMGQIDGVLGDLTGVADILHHEPDFGSIMFSQTIKSEEKAELIRRIFKGKISDLTLDFLTVLARRDRMNLLNGISSRYEKMVDFHQNRHAVEVTVSKPLADDKIQTLQGKIEKAIGANVKLSVEVDPEIIGGVVLRKGDRQIDNSVRTALKKAMVNLK